MPDWRQIAETMPALRRELERLCECGLMYEDQEGRIVLSEGMRGWGRPERRRPPGPLEGEDGLRIEERAGRALLRTEEEMRGWGINLNVTVNNTYNTVNNYNNIYAGGQYNFGEGAQYTEIHDNDNSIIR